MTTRNNKLFFFLFIFFISSLTLKAEIFSLDFLKYISQRDSSLILPYLNKYSLQSIPLVENKIQHQYAYAKYYAHINNPLAIKYYDQILQLERKVQYENEYINYLINYSYLEKFNHMLKNNINSGNEEFYQSKWYFYHDNFDSATIYIESYMNKYNNAEDIDLNGAPQRLFSLLTNKEKIKSISPAKAATLSVIIPGSGKWYAKHPADGMMSLMTILIGSINSYRNLTMDSGSISRGILWGSSTLWFYASTIYGSYKTAEKYNANQKLDYIDKYYE
ncbi:hypothetical protein KAJ27_01125 [bacterium]|nr:hypothetical protein [bacterium]